MKLPFKQVPVIPRKKPRSPPFHFSSHLESSYREELDQLFFFNPRQYRVKNQVLAAVSQYGPPEIRETGGSITLGVKHFQGAQALFILPAGKRAPLMGGLIYIREADRLIVLYLALKPAFTKSWQGSCALLVSVTDALRAVARQINGVTLIEFRVGARLSLIRIR